MDIEDLLNEIKSIKEDINKIDAKVGPVLDRLTKIETLIIGVEGSQNGPLLSRVCRLEKAIEPLKYFRAQLIAYATAAGVIINAIMQFFN